MNPFPTGNVATARYSTYCKALAKGGAFVKVYIIAPSRTAACNIHTQGKEDGVEYQYMCNKTGLHKKPSWGLKLFYYTFGLLRTIFYLRKDRINCILLYANDFYSYIFLWLFKRYFGIRLISEKSEYPYGYKSEGWFGRKFDDIKLKVFDGFIVMTEELRIFYSNKMSRHARVFLLPMTVDAVRFSVAIRSKPPCPYIACVFGTHNRDNLIDTVTAYSIYLKIMKKEAFKLLLIGDIYNLKDDGIVSKYINDNKLHEFISFSGVVSNELIPELLANSSALITTARSYISGGFPTKLGEYLASGRPVVATTAGEISNYLENEVHAYLARPGDVNEIADCLVKIHKDNNTAEIIARAGQRLSHETFNAETYVNSLTKFLILS